MKENINEIKENTTAENCEIEAVIYKKTDAEKILNMINLMTFQGVNNARIIAEISNILEHPIEVGKNKMNCVMNQ